MAGIGKSSSRAVRFFALGAPNAQTAASAFVKLNDEEPDIRLAQPISSGLCSRCKYLEHDLPWSVACGSVLKCSVCPAKIGHILRHALNQLRNFMPRNSRDSRPSVRVLISSIPGQGSSAGVMPVARTVPAHSHVESLAVVRPQQTGAPARLGHEP